MNYRNAIKNKDGFINCEVEHPKYGWIPFQASIDDTSKDGVKLYNLMNSDPSLQYESDEEYYNRVALKARAYRDSLLRLDVDPIMSNQIRFNELPIEKREEWKQYRTLLLDITKTTGFPHNIDWPNKPK